MDTVDISVVIPVYNSAEMLPTLHSRLQTVLTEMKKSFEVVYVDDGSSDKSLELLTSYAAKEKRIRSVEFNRNYGQHAAVFADNGGEPYHSLNLGLLRERRIDRFHFADQAGRLGRTDALR